MAGHVVIEEWRGKRVKTLEDLLRPRLRAVCVGINPAPPSVEAGHYYQGRAGQQFFGRLRSVGAIPAVSEGFEDDAAFASGIGFTDIVNADAVRDPLGADGAHQLGGSTDLLRLAGAIRAAPYAGLAFAIEDLRGGALLPVVRHGRANEALDLGFEAQATEAENAPGVRRQL